MSKFTVRKSIFIVAPPEQVFATVRNFRHWPEWSPWLITDPETRLTFSSDGSSYSWDGRITGNGEISIVTEDAPRSIDYRLEFLNPWKSVNSVSFRFDAKDGGTEVTWLGEGSLPFFLFWMKAMMGAFIGSDYQRGLMMLKDLLETGTVPSKLEFTGRQSFPGMRYIGVNRHCAISEIQTHIGKDLESLAGWLAQNGVTPAGQPFSSYHKWDPVKETTGYTVGIPLAATLAQAPAGFVCGVIPPCEVFTIRHTGAYRFLGNAWAAGICRQRMKVIRANKAIHPFEVYENDPRETAESNLVSSVHFPVK